MRKFWPGEVISEQYPSSPPTSLCSLNLSALNLGACTDFKVAKTLKGNQSSALTFPSAALFSGLHQSLPPGERHLRGQEEDQVGQEVSGSPLQPGLGLF